MLNQLTRATRARSVVAAVTRRSAGNQARNFIAPTVSRRADFVQELYLKELKSYKTPVVKASDADAHVKVFSAPQTPTSPEEADLAGSLKEYESMAVEIEGQDASASVDGAQAEIPDWLETEDVEEGKAH
ncbi:F-type H+-transporting ATPase subunit h [Geosmithia morbida]|uniref:F-type H+-transporting ATPase subunit h n=1 Tax=Geosmithia morbida TaxID=1094350 RepID=A0A9P4YXT3_9HYPO|nr:F-type H+-transporting ATPase subunit h [Geosmithia morbida]KAF4124015.1 F-type H+-transporting ATPase subunit h [Geosmithia morbida]